MNSISIPMTELKPALAGLGKIISRRVTLPVLGYVRIARTQAGQIELAATDLDTSVVVQLDTPAQGEPTAFLIPFEDLNNVAKSCRRQDTLIVTPVEENRVAIRFPVGGQMIEHQCDSLPLREFPGIDSVRAEPIPLSDALRSAIGDAMECASTDPTRIILNGACLDVSNPAGHYVVATDGSHLFSSNSFKLPLKDSVVIPSHRFLGWKEFNQDGDWSLRSAKPDKDQPPQFEIASRHWRFIARSHDGHYPNWRAVVPDSGSVKTTLEIEQGAVEVIIQTVARMPDHDPKHHAIGLEIEGRQFRLLGKSPGSETWARVELSGVKVTGQDVRIFLNRQFLTKALRFGLTRVEIIDPLTPLRFSNGGRQMIVMPVRANDESAAPAADSSQSTPPPTSGQQASTTPAPLKSEQPETKTMTENNGATRSTTAATVAPADKPALESALSQIEVIRAEFRNAITGLSKLGDLLKQTAREQKASEREIQSVRQTLRSLQGVRI